MITRFRTSSHKLNVEIGRHHNVSRRNRICTKCNLRDIEDEYHFIFICPLYNDLRHKFVKPYYYRVFAEQINLTMNMYERLSMLVRVCG